MLEYQVSKNFITLSEKAQVVIISGINITKTSAPLFSNFLLILSSVLIFFFNLLAVS